MKQLIEDLISAMEYHVEQTRPIHSTTVALQAAREAIRAKPAPVESVAVKHMMGWVETLKRQSDYGQHMRIPGLNAGACFELAIELEQFINTTPPAAPVQSCYCPNCEAMGKELAELKAQSAPVQEPVAIPEYIRDAAKHLHENRFEPSFMVRAIVGWINGTPPAQPAPVQEPVATIDSLEQEIYENTREFVSLNVMEWLLKRLNTTPPAAAPVEDVDWKEQYEKQKRRSDMWVAKYEKDIGPIEYAAPAAAQPAPVPDAIHHTDLSESLEYIQGWNDCRQAMLEMMK